MISWNGDALLDLVERRVDQGLDEAADALLDEIQARAPVQSGALRDSIHVEAEGDDERTVVADAPYALTVELGTEDTPARPYLRTGFDAARDKMIRSFDHK